MWGEIVDSDAPEEPEGPEGRTDEAEVPGAVAPEDAKGFLSPDERNISTTAPAILLMSPSARELLGNADGPEESPASLSVDIRA